MLVLWQSLLASFKSYLMEAKKKEKLRKIEIFFEKFQCDSLKNEIIACKFDFHCNGGTFSDTANVMADHVQPVSQSQQFGRNQNVSAMGTTHTGTAPSSGIYLEDTTIFTGNMSVRISSSSVGRKWSLSRMIGQVIVVLRPKAVKRKLRLLKGKVSLHLRK